MRKSLQKMPPSGLSSRVGPPTGLAPVAAAERAPKRNVAVRLADRPHVAVTVDDDELLQAQLRLLEGFVSRTEVAESAQYALRWLKDVVGIAQSVCLVKSPGE